MDGNTLLVDGYPVRTDNVSLTQQIVNILQSVNVPQEVNLSIIPLTNGTYISPTNINLRDYYMGNPISRAASEAMTSMIDRVFAQLANATTYINEMTEYLENLLQSIRPLHQNINTFEWDAIANIQLIKLRQYIRDKFQQWIDVQAFQVRENVQRRIPNTLFFESQRNKNKISKNVRKIEQFLRMITYFSKYLTKQKNRKMLFLASAQGSQHIFGVEAYHQLHDLHEPSYSLPNDTLTRYVFGGLVNGRVNSLYYLDHIDTIRLQLAISSNLNLQSMLYNNLNALDNYFTDNYLFPLPVEMVGVQSRVVLRLKIWARRKQGEDQPWKQYLFDENSHNVYSMNITNEANPYVSALRNFADRFQNLNLESLPLQQFANANGEDYSTDFSELLSAHHVRLELWIQLIHRIQGGCDIKHNHRAVVKNDDSGIELHIESMVSRSNNCGIQLFIRFYKDLIRQMKIKSEDIPYEFIQYTKKQAKSLKKEIFPNYSPNQSLSLEDLDELCEYFKTDITVYSNEFDIVKNTSFLFHCRLFVYYDRKNQHYWYVKNIKCKTPLTCNTCFAQYVCNHVCIEQNKIEKIEEERKKCVDMYVEMKMEMEMDDGCNQEEKEYFPKESYDILDSLLVRKKHVLIHGPGGTGKTSTIRYVTKRLKKCDVNVCVTAMTGIAATHINGVTLHSAIRLGINIFKPIEEVVKKWKKDVKYLRFVQNLQILIIDEISMMNDILFRRLHCFLSMMRDNNLLFGGVQLVMSGDVLQLPPVASVGYPSFFFRSPLFEEIVSYLDIFHYTTIYRQGNLCFQNTLNNIRIGQVEREYIQLLQSRLTSEEKEDFLHLFAKRHQVINHNKKMIDRLSRGDKEKYVFIAEDNNGTMLLNRHSLIPEKLVLVEGVRVMIVRNLQVGQHKIFNGDQGVFLEYNQKIDKIKIRLDRGLTLWLEKSVFSLPMLHFDELDKVPSRKQFPILLAYAITIHKSQGMTLHNVVIDIGDSVFETSQIYVALSRVSDIQGLYLKSFSPDKIKVKREALLFNTFVEKNNFYKQQIQNSKTFLSFASNELNVFLHTNEWISHDLHYKKFNLLEKTVFFDFETYVDEKTQILYPYYNHLLYFENGKIMQSTTFQLGRNSEDVAKSSFDWLFRLLDKDDKSYITKYKKGGVAGQWSRYKPIYLCAYNGSNFDFHWLLKYLIQNEEYGKRYSSHQVFKGSSLITISLYDEKHGRIVLKSHDICNILTSSLDEAVKSFCNESLKGVFPHKYMNKIQGRISKENEMVVLSLEDFFESHHEKVREMEKRKELYLSCYDIQSELEKYGKSDVLIMVKLYKSVDELCRNVLKTNIFTFNTASAMTRWGFMINLPKNGILQRKKKCIITKINSWNANDEEKIRKAVYAGKTLPRIVQFSSSEVTHHDDLKSTSYEEIDNDYYVYLDASGFYASVMLNYKYPVGPYRYLTQKNMEDRMDLYYLKTSYSSISRLQSTHDDSTLPFFIGYCHIIPNVHDIEPCIGRRDENNRLHWDNQPRWGWYSSVSVELAIRAGGKLEMIEECFTWSESCYVFRKWMEYTISLKNSSEVGKKKLGKLLGNGTYGINLQRLYTDVIKIVKNRDQLNDFHQKYQWTDVFPSETNLIMKGNPFVNETICSGHPVHLGVFILDYTKKIIHEITEAANPYRYSGNYKSIVNQPLYGDTDSLVFHASQLRRIYHLIGKNNGQWGDEIYDKWGVDNFAKITHWIGPQPKMYSFYAKLPDEKVYTKLKCKGIPQNDISFVHEGKEMKKMTFDVLQQLVKEEQKLEIHMHNRLKKLSYRLSKLDKMKDVKAFSIRSEKISRTLFQSQWKGRRFLSEVETLKLEMERFKNMESFPGNYFGYTVPNGWKMQES